MAKNLTDRLANTRVGGLFFKAEDQTGPDDREDQPQVATAQTRTVPAAFGSGATVPTVPLNLATSFVSSNVDPEVRAKLQAIADGADQVSFTKFKELIKSINSSFSDEASCYRAAFAGGKVFNLPASEVLRGVDAILNELTQAERKFKTAAPQRVAAKVGARREKIAQIKQAVSSKREEIQRLQEQLNRLNAEIGQLSQAEQTEQAAITQDEQGVREDAEKFAIALEAVRAPFVAERQKIELYGKGV